MTVSLPCAQHMFAGALAGITEHIAMYPVDTIKTRMQALAHPGQQVVPAQCCRARHACPNRPLASPTAAPPECHDTGKGGSLGSRAPIICALLKCVPDACDLGIIAIRDHTARCSKACPFLAFGGLDVCVD